jgi:hypothetical protein
LQERIQRSKTIAIRKSQIQQNDIDRMLLRVSNALLQPINMGQLSPMQEATLEEFLKQTGLRSVILNQQNAFHGTAYRF